MRIDEIRDFLRKTGHLTIKPKESKQEKAEKFSLAVERYRHYFGLPQNNTQRIIDAPLLRTFHEPRICGVPDIQPYTKKGYRGELCRWPRGHTITWTIKDPLPNFSHRDQLDIIQRAFSDWTAASSGLKSIYTSNARTANIYFTIMRERPGQVLADMQIPCSSTSRSRMQGRIDTEENWDVYSYSDSTEPRKVSLLTVLEHELGHALGIFHIEPRRGTALLNPTYSNRVPTITDLDREELLKRYPGVPSEPPRTGGEENHTVGIHTRVWIDGEIYQMKGLGKKIRADRSVQMWETP